MDRNYSLDYIRVIAMVGILVDHAICFYGSNSLNYSGIQLGGGSVTIFFIISALLFGSKWAKNDFKPYTPIAFMKKRVLRIYVPLWGVVLATIPLEYWIKSRFEPMTIGINAVGLGWAHPFGVSGHLWYITMLMLLYISFVGISYIRFDRVKWYWWLLAFVSLTLFYFIFQSYMTTYSKAGPPMFLLVSALMFCKGKKILEWSANNKLLVSLSAIIMVNISQYIYQLGWHDSHKAMAVWSFIVAGFLSFLALSIWLQRYPEGKALSCVMWFSAISYEIYLVHQPLLEVCNLLFPNRIMMTIVWLIMTILTAVLLSKLTNVIYKRI